MASNNVMNHTIGGNLYDQLQVPRRPVVSLRRGRRLVRLCLDRRSRRSLYRMWMASPSHRALLMSRVQLHRPRPGLSLVQPADVRVGGHDRVARPHARDRRRVTGAVGRRRRELDLERVRRPPPDPHRRPPRLRRPVPDRLRILADPPQRHDRDVACPARPRRTASTTRSACEGPTGVAMWGRGRPESRIWVP